MDQLLENAVAKALGLKIEPRSDDAKRSPRNGKSGWVAKADKPSLH